MQIEIRSKYLITSFSSYKLLATFDNVAGSANRLIYSFFHIEVDDHFFCLLEKYVFVKVVHSQNIETHHPEIKIIAFMPQVGYTNVKMENMFCDILRYYCRDLE